MDIVRHVGTLSAMGSLLVGVEIEGLIALWTAVQKNQHSVNGGRRSYSRKLGNLWHDVIKKGGRDKGRESYVKRIKTMLH